MEEKKPFDWVEHFRPIPHGGLRVFLWTVVFFLEMAIGLECFKFENFPWNEAPVVIILIGLALVHFAVQMLMGSAFLVCLLVENREHFKWMQRYIANNVYSARLHFFCNNRGLIRLSANGTSIILRAEKPNLQLGENEKSVQFSVRLGGWFFRCKMSPIVGCQRTMPFIDVSPLMKKGHSRVHVCFLLNSSVVDFPSLEEAVDYLIMDYGPLPATLRKLTYLQPLESAAHLATKLEFTLSEMLQLIQNCLKQNPRLAEHRAANELLVTLLEKLAYGFRKAQDKLEANLPAELSGLSLNDVMPWLDRTYNQIRQLEESRATATARNAKVIKSTSPEPPPESPKQDSPAE